MKLNKSTVYNRVKVICVPEVVMLWIRLTVTLQGVAKSWFDISYVHAL